MSYVENRGGVHWTNAPIPRRWHRCRAQTWGETSSGMLVDRCACGAIRINGSPWMQRNSRKKVRS